MAQNETWLKHDLMKAVRVQYLDGNLFSMDNAGNLIGVTLTRDGEDYTGGGSVSANVIRADGGTVTVTGALSGNAATVVLPQAAYVVPGAVSIVVKLTASGQVTTIAAIVANVYRSSTDTPIDPGTIIPSVQALIAAIDTAVASIPADYSSLWASLAPAFSSSTAYTAGQYVTYNGGLYRFTTDHAAGAWSSSQVASTNIGGELSDLKSAIKLYTGNEEISFVSGKYVYNDATKVYPSDIRTSSTGYKYAIVDCSEGDTFTVSGTSGVNNPIAWAFASSDGTILKQSSMAVTITNAVVVAPENTSYLVINAKGTAKSYYGKIIKDIVSTMQTAIDYAEDYLYTELLEDTFVFTGISGFHNLSEKLYAGKQYIVTLEFKDITNNNLSKITAIRLYRGSSSLNPYDDLTFGVPYPQMQDNVKYSTYYTPSADYRSCLLVAFESTASFSTDNVTITVEDMSVKFAGIATESVANSAKDALLDTLTIGDIQFTRGYYQKTNGTTEANNNFMVSDFIKVTEGLQLTYAIHGYNNVAVVCIFASDKTTVKRSIYATTEQDLSGTITFEAGEEYVRFCRWSTTKGANDTLSMQIIIDVSAEIDRIDNTLATIGDTQWNGKIWHCFGTSISNASNEGKYPPYLVALSGLQYVNFGYSGGKMTQQILAQIKGDSGIANADLITVEGFVNDWSQQSPLGQITDTTADTFCGAIYEAITYILEHSNATLVFITDSTGRNYNSVDIRREAVRNGKTQNDFIEATIKMCNYMGIPVIDAGRKSCISQDTATLYLADQIHHTEKGGEQYAQTIWSELKNIKPRIK